MNNNQLVKLNIKPQSPFASFQQGFLKSFFVNLDFLPLTEDLLRQVETTLNDYEKTELDWHLEESLRLHNNLLTY